MMSMDCDVFIIMGVDECGDEFRWNDEEYLFPTDLITDEEGYHTYTYLAWEDETLSKVRGEYPEAQGCFLVNLSAQKRYARAMARMW